MRWAILLAAYVISPMHTPPLWLIWAFIIAFCLDVANSE
jgi:hypothetical protein